MFDGRSVAPERTQWRDLRFSERHRLWGWDCPAVDIDFLMLQYDRAVPTALVEYKHAGAKKQDRHHPSYRALCALGNSAHLPVFAVRYDDVLGYYIFTLNALNGIARTAMNDQTQVPGISELEYVEFLYKLENRTLDKKTRDVLIAHKTDLDWKPDSSK